MGLVTGYETIKSKAFYFIEFDLGGQRFSMNEGIENPEDTLYIVNELREKGIFPNLSRTIVYDRDKSGFFTKEPEHEDLTFNRLEEIVEKKEALPKFKKEIVEAHYG